MPKGPAAVLADEDANLVDMGKAGATTRLQTQDDPVRNLLEQLLAEAKKTNLYLSSITETDL